MTPDILLPNQDSIQIDADVLLDRLKELNHIGIALSSEKDSQRLLERILEAAKNLTGADGGTLYTMTENGASLKFETLLNDTLDIHQGGTSGNEINFSPLPICDKNGKYNTQMVAVSAAVTEKTINIPDAYQDTHFEFSGTRKFDVQMNYRSQSFLTVPMKDHQNEVIGVLQLINSINAKTGKIKPFAQWEQELVESLASQAAVALVNQRLIEEQKELFESFIKLIAGAIDDKSPYTGGHCKRVPELTMMLANAAAECQHGSKEINQFKMNEDDQYALWVAAMLHDCGKITTKEYVVDKATKLETIFDRIYLISTRFAVLKQEAENKMLKRQVAALQAGEQIDTVTMQAELDAEFAVLDDELRFLQHNNVGGEFMAEAAQERVKRIAQRRWTDAEGQTQALLSDDKSVEQQFYPLKYNETRSEGDLCQSRGEVENLCIPKGTLRECERKHINYHITATLHMLESLPYPKQLECVPEYAGGHHERMDGKGYPKGLKRDEMSLQARVVGIADIFEALTADDRPYKDAMSLSVALNILGKMKLDNHIDPDLFDVFIHNKLYQDYADIYLKPAQIDEVDVTQLPGFNPDFAKNIK